MKHFDGDGQGHRYDQEAQRQQRVSRTTDAGGCHSERLFHARIDWHVREGFLHLVWYTSDDVSGAHVPRSVTATADNTLFRFDSPENDPVHRVLPATRSTRVAELACTLSALERLQASLRDTDVVMHCF